MTLDECCAAVNLITRTRGGTSYRTTDLYGLVGRCLVDFVEVVRCNYSPALFYTALSANAGAIQIDTATFTVVSTSESVRLIAPTKIWIEAGMVPLELADARYMTQAFPSWPSDRGTPKRFFMAGPYRLHCHPGFDADTPIRVEGYHHAIAVTSLSAGSVVLNIPTDCHQTFIDFVAAKALVSVSDGTTANARQDVLGDVTRAMKRLKGKYRQVPEAFGYVGSGDVIRI